MRSRHTTPPKVLPLLPICLIAVYLGQAVFGVAHGVLALVGVESSDEPATVILYAIVAQVAVAVALGFVLRWIVERWVGLHPPRRAPRYDGS